MKSNSLILGIASTLTLSTVGFLSGSAKALTLTNTSGNWSSVIGGQEIEFQTVGEENQVLWGISAGFGKSGLGFTGVGETEINIGESFLIGTLRHFNNPIDYAAEGADLTLDLSFSDPIIAESFNFTLQIDETPNVEPCTYAGTSICPDKIFFPDNISDNYLQIDGKNYALELLGLSTTPDGTPINGMISEELGGDDVQFYLIGEVKPIPEPGMILGLSAIGLYFAGRRRKQ